MPPPRYVLNSATNGLFNFILTDGNARVILTSRTYLSKTSAVAGIESVRVYSQNEERYDRGRYPNDQYYFDLTDLNGQDIGTSETYDSPGTRDHGIRSVRQNGLSGEIVDNCLTLPKTHSV